MGDYEFWIAYLHFVSSALTARGVYCRVPKKSGADTFSQKERADLA
jgi:hypothetical protein